jgi:glyoxylase-like metal-dependent hydrolase (beta-lactamase superfamily II)
MWMHPAHQAFTDAAVEPERIYAARERRALAEGVPPEEVHDYADVGEEREAALGPLPRFSALRDGTVVDSTLGPWRTLETPGHTPSHVCLYHEAERLLVIGDLVSRIYAPWFDYGYSADPVAEFLASLDLVDRLDVELALPGHGRPIEDVADVVAMHREELHTRVELVAAAVAAEPGTAYDLGRRVFREVDHSYEAVSRLLETMAYLKHLRATGRVVRTAGRDGVFLYSSS